MHPPNGSVPLGSYSAEEVDEQTDAGGEYLIVLPTLVIFGILGNILSLVTILNTRLRKVRPTIGR